MRRPLELVLTLCFGLLPLIGVAGDIDDTLKSVVRVETGHGLGSGFVFQTQSAIVTNFHVVEGADTLKAFFHDGSTIEIDGFLFADPEADLAIIHLTKPCQCEPLLISSEPVDLGSDVFALGSPRGLAGSVSKGVISSYRRWVDLKEFLGDDYDAFGYDPNSNWVQTDAAITQGNSGGPLVLKDGTVIGINTLSSSAQLGQNLNFAVDASHLESVSRRMPTVVRDLASLPKPKNPSRGTLEKKGEPTKTAAYWEQLRGIFVELHASLAKAIPAETRRKPATPKERKAAKQREEQERRDLMRVSKMAPHLQPAEMQRIISRRALEDSEVIQDVARACMKAAREVQSLDRTDVDGGLRAFAADLVMLYRETADTWGNIDTLSQAQARAGDSVDAAVNVNLQIELDKGIDLTERVKRMRNVVSEDVRFALEARYTIKLPPITQDQSHEEATGGIASEIEKAKIEAKADGLWNSYLRAKAAGSGQKTLQMLLEKYPDTTAGRRAKEELEQLRK
jgi:hypothetical protein